MKLHQINSFELPTILTCSTPSLSENNGSFPRLSLVLSSPAPPSFELEASTSPSTPSVPCSSLEVATPSELGVVVVGSAGGGGGAGIDLLREQVRQVSWIRWEWVEEAERDEGTKERENESVRER